MTEHIKCKYLLPCGNCDKFNCVCRVLESNSIQIESPPSIQKGLEGLGDIQLLNQPINWAELQVDTIPKCCMKCNNHPINGGSGICNCTLPYFENNTTASSSPNIS